MVWKERDMGFVRNKSRVVALVIVVAGLNVPVPVMGRSVSGWQGRETSHFAILSNTQEAGGQEILDRLETARVFFERTGWANQTPQLSVLALDDASQADVYRINPAAYAFYQKTREGDFVIIRDLMPEHFPVAVHEYTHFVVEHAGLRLPLWLNEGVADLYSTLVAHKDQVIVGEAPAGRMDTLANRHWMDWGTLMAVDHESAYYREPEKMLQFYAQSWALVHMLALDPQYEPGFTKFLQAVSAGATADAAMSAVYHKDLTQVEQDVRSYVGSKRMGVRVMDVDVRLPSLETTDVSDAGRRIEFAMADILATNPQLAPEANQRLAALAVKYPDDPRSEESLGFLAMRANHTKEAEEHFARAVRQHSQNPEVWFRLAHLKLQDEGAAPEVVDLLQRVIASDGDHYSARLELGFAAAKSENYELAVKALQGIGKVRPEHEYVVSYTLAYCLVEIHQGNQARMYAAQASKIAASNKDRNEVAGLVRYIDQETPVEVASRE